MIETPVEVLQHELELERLVDLYRARRPRRVLEVGTFAGGTLYHWLTHAAPFPPLTVVVAIDTYLHRDNRDLYPEWMQDGTELVVIEGDSSDTTVISQAAALGPYEWVYIDADHYLESVRRDWQAYGALAAPGGLVVLHDITPTPDPTIEVDRLWAELEQGHDTETIVEPGGFGFGIVHVALPSTA
jgi:predicted O-methyltransferase YrrM